MRADLRSASVSLQGWRPAQLLLFPPPMVPLLVWWLLFPSCPVRADERYADFIGHYVCDRAGGCRWGHALSVERNRLVFDEKEFPLLVLPDDTPQEDGCAVVVALTGKPTIPVALVRTREGLQFGLGELEPYVRAPRP